MNQRHMSQVGHSQAVPAGRRSGHVRYALKATNVGMKAAYREGLGRRLMLIGGREKTDRHVVYPKSNQAL